MLFFFLRTATSPQIILSVREYESPFDITVSPLILQKQVLRGASGVNIYVYVDKPTVQWTWNTHSADKYWKLRFVGTYKYILQTQAHRGDDPDPSQGAHHRRGTVRRACAQPQVSGA